MVSMKSFTSWYFFRHNSSTIAHPIRYLITSFPLKAPASFSIAIQCQPDFLNYLTLIRHLTTIGSENKQHKRQTVKLKPT